MRTILIACLWILPGWAAAQEVIGSDAFLEKIIKGPSRPSDDYPSRRRVRLPWIEAYEYRTETDEFDPERQEHLLRFSPTSPGIRKAQSRLAEHYQRKPSIVETSYRNDRIESAYEAWKDLYISEQRLSAYTRLQAILTDRLTIRRKQVQSLDADVKDVLDMREKLNDVRIRRYELELSTKNLRAQFGLETAAVAFDDMVTVDQIMLRLATDSIETNDLLWAEYHYDRELIDKEIALEKAEKRQLLDFVQVRYNGPHNDLWEERVALQAGLVLPTSGSRNLKLEELRIEQEMLDREQQVKSQELGRLVSERRQTVRDHIRVYQTLERIKDQETSQLKEIAQAVANRQGSDPDLLLKINEDTEEIRLEKLERLEEIYEDYLEYLILTGQLFAQPFENHLAN